MLNVVRLPRAWMLALAMLLPAVSAHAETASGAALARDVVVRVQQLRMEVSMMVYDETTESYRKQARTLLDEIDAPLQSAVQELNSRDAASAAAVADSWKTIRGSLVGGKDFGKGMLNTGYDAKVHGDIDTGMQTLTGNLEKAWKLADKSVSTPEARASLLAAKIVSNYVQVAGAPFGAYTMSANADDSDPGKLVTQMDEALQELTAKYASDKEKAQKLKGIAARWQFIRIAILKTGKQATPFIVYRHGGDIIRDLSTL